MVEFAQAEDFLFEELGDLVNLLGCSAIFAKREYVKDLGHVQVAKSTYTVVLINHALHLFVFWLVEKSFDCTNRLTFLDPFTNRTCDFFANFRIIQIRFSQVFCFAWFPGPTRLIYFNFFYFLILLNHMLYLYFIVSPVKYIILRCCNPI